MLVVLLTQGKKTEDHFPAYDLRSGMTEKEAIHALEDQGFKRVMENETYEILFASHDLLGFAPTVEELDFPGGTEYELRFYFYASGTNDDFPQNTIADMRGTYNKLKEALIRELGQPDGDGDYLTWRKDTVYTYILDYTTDDFFSFAVVVN